jgi:hypothetical protein
MKKLFTVGFILFFICAKADYWTQKASFGGTPRLAPFSFAIGNKGYIGCGEEAAHTFPTDFWEYDQATNIWTQKANFAGVGRSVATGFSINGKGYVGTGYSNPLYLKDFWEYDPISNSWTQKANFGGLARGGPVGFSINNKGYIGIGDNGGYFQDFWEYDPLINSWTQKMNFGSLHTLATGFSDGIKGYLGTGSEYGIYPYGMTDFWEWDPNTNIWTQKANYGGAARNEACSFWLCPFGYIGLGTTQIGVGTLSDFWKYNVSSNTWTQAATFSPGLREMAAAFSIGNKGYVGTGFINDVYTSVMNDFWEYTPDSACATGIEEASAPLSMTVMVSPNPAKDFIVVNISGFKKVEYLSITDVEGRKVYETKVPSSNFQLPISNLQKGIYFVEVNNGKQKGVRKFLKE